jgi:hypothetical protein
MRLGRSGIFLAVFVVFDGLKTAGEREELLGYFERWLDRQFIILETKAHPADLNFAPSRPDRKRG